MEQPPFPSIFSHFPKPRTLHQSKGAHFPEVRARIYNFARSRHWPMIVAGAILAGQFSPRASIDGDDNEIRDSGIIFAAVGT